MVAVPLRPSTAFTVIRRAAPLPPKTTLSLGTSTTEPQSRRLALHVGHVEVDGARVVVAAAGSAGGHRHRGRVVDGGTDQTVRRGSAEPVTGGPTKFVRGQRDAPPVPSAGDLTYSGWFRLISDERGLVQGAAGANAGRATAVASPTRQQR